MLTTGYEFTTAATDLINAIVAFIPICWLIKHSLAVRRHKLWAISYALFSLNSFIGFIVHGFHLPENINLIIWSALYIVLGVMLAMYVSSVRYDIHKEEGFDRFIRNELLISVVVAAVIAVINVIDYHYSFPLFSLYGILNVGMVVVQLFKIIKTDRRFLWYLLAITAFFSGNILQAINTIRFTLIWEFNHDSVYHFMMLLFLLIQFKGIKLLENKKEL